jgi:acyl-CoA synthetase (AMP-forming)/AMP-acid ligase II
MGLIGGLLYPFFTGFPVHLLSPLCFQMQPLSWLTAMHEARATHTAGPPSAYAVALRLARRAEGSGLRFDRLRCAMIGAEPIPPALLRAFGDAFAPCGLRREALFPVYGLAEATVAVTFPRVLAPARVERVDRAALERDGRAQPATDGPAVELTGTGSPLPGTQIRITGPDGAALPERHVGEIQVRAPTLMARYDAEPEATAAALEGGWLRTGDLGFLDGGDLFVTGRLKDLLIKGGHNVYPEPVEATAGAVEGVRPGCVVAAGVRSDLHGTERIAVVAETRLGEEAWPALRDRVREALRSTGVVVDEVVLVPPGWLPRTTSGKLRRAEVTARLATRGAA